MLCVTMIERIVRNTSRPMSTGRQTFTNASSPTKARSPIESVAHGSRWPPPPNLTERPPQMPAPRKARRQRSSRSGPNCESSPIATTSSQTIVARGPSRTPSSMTIRGATTSEPSPRSTPSPIRAPASRSAVDLVCRRERPERLVVERLEECGSRRPMLSSRSKVDGSETPSGRDCRESWPDGRRRRAFCAASELLDVLLGDEAPFLDRREVDAVQLGKLDCLARRLPIARSGLRSGRLLSLWRRWTPAPRAVSAT